MPQVHGLCLILVWPNGPNIAKTIVHAIYESKLCTPEIETILSIVTDELEQIKKKKKIQFFDPDYKDRKRYNSFAFFVLQALDSS